MTISFQKTSRVWMTLGAAAALTSVAACERRDTTVSERTDDTRPASPEIHSGEIVTKDSAKVRPVPTIEAKDPLKAADGDMKKVLVELNGLGAKSVSTLGVEAARKQPTPADAVLSVMKKENKSTAPVEMAKVEERKIGTNLARIYTPKTKDKKPLPVVVYYHGGGFVIADINTYDASARSLAKESNAIVVSADYRHAPENKLPAAYDDALAAYEWTLKNAASFGGDPKKVAVAGESAGGNLAANVAIAARDKGIQQPVHELLVYPIAQTSQTTKSYNEWANAMPLDKASVGWFLDKSGKQPGDIADPRLALIDANLRGLPPTTIILAEIDPLRSDGDVLAERLEAAGVKTEKKTYEGVTHEFFGMGGFVADAKSAEEYAGGRLKSAFAK